MIPVDTVPIFKLKLWVEIACLPILLLLVILIVNHVCAGKNLVKLVATITLFGVHD
jgi:hypothetical protein